MHPRAVARAAHDLATRLLLAPRLRYEWRNPPFSHPNERAVEYAFALRSLQSVGPRTVLDVGPGTSAWPHLLANCGFKVTAVDETGSYWGRVFFNRHYHVLRDDITKPALDGQFDAVTCISTLEHIPDYKAAVRGIFALTRPDGHIVLTFPYNEERFVEDAYREPGADVEPTGNICRIYSRQTLEGWLSENRGTLVEQRYYRVFTGSLWRQGERIRAQPVELGRDDPHDLCCLLIRKRASR